MSETNSPQRPGFWKRFWFIVRVAEVRLRFIFVLVLSGVLIGYWDVIKNHYDKYTRPPGAHSHAAHSDTEFFCPMHTFIIRSEFAKCPICGMDLVKRKKGEAEELPEGAVARVQLMPMQVTEGGVRVEQVERRLLSYETRSVGVVEESEESQATIAARFPGRVEKLLVNFVGAQVEPNQPIARIYSPKYLAAAQEYVQALQAVSRAAAGDKSRAEALAEAARQRLVLAGFTSDQVAEIARKGRADAYLTYYSPIGGTVMTRSAVEGQYVDEGEALLRVADLSRIWVQVQVLESDLAKIKVHQPVEIRSVSYPGTVFLGNVSFIYPAVDPETRTVKVRVEVQNSKLMLKPGMYVTAVIRSPVGRFVPLEPPDTGHLKFGDGLVGGVLGNTTTTTLYASGGETGQIKEPEESPDIEWEEGYTCVMHPDHLQAKPGPCNLCDCGMRLTKWKREKIPAVPERAVIDTGTRKFVYVEKANGIFDAHKVILGARTAGDYYPVLAGLRPGMPVATVGSFLIDAENRLNPASAINKPEEPTEEVAEATVVVQGGYKPKTLKLNPDQPRRIVFDRRDEGECTDEVVFPTLGIRVTLPPYEKTVIDLPTTATGEIQYTCGMDMLRGTIIAEADGPAEVVMAPSGEATTGSANAATPESGPGTNSDVTSSQGAVVVVDGGYEPDIVTIKEGQPRQIVFDRRDEGICTDEIMFPTLGIKLALPPHQKTVVDLPTTATGEIKFSCGMDMLQGKVIIE